ncbi:MAG: hypothetical protein HYV96_18280 [Opitutae bacterium]|nr:hypothetical protein [Opitutae bacterium]
MKIWISGEIDADIADDYRRLRQKIESDFAVHLAAIDAGESIQELAFIPMITSLAQGLNPEVAKFSKRRKEAEFRPAIDHAAFKAADSTGRQNMLLDSLQQCVQRLPELGATDVDVPRILQCINQLRDPQKGVW